MNSTLSILSNLSGSDVTFTFAFVQCKRTLTIRGLRFRHTKLEQMKNGQEGFRFPHSHYVPVLINSFCAKISQDDKGSLTLSEGDVANKLVFNSVHRTTC